MRKRKWEARITKLEKFSEHEKLIYAKPNVKRMISEMRELWEELKAVRAQPAGNWIKCSERLPEKYRDVPIQTAEGDEASERVGRLNAHGVWEIASYQNCKHQYASSNVVRWFDTNVPANFTPTIANEAMLEDGVEALDRGMQKFPLNYTQIVSNIWEDMSVAVPSPWVSIKDARPEPYRPVALRNTNQFMNTGSDDFECHWHGAGWLCDGYWSVIGERSGLTLEAVTDWFYLPVEEIDDE